MVSQFEILEYVDLRHGCDCSRYKYRIDIDGYICDATLIFHLAELIAPPSITPKCGWHESYAGPIFFLLWLAFAAFCVSTKAIVGKRKSVAKINTGVVDMLFVIVSA